MLVWPCILYHSMPVSFWLQHHLQWMKAIKCHNTIICYLIQYIFFKIVYLFFKCLIILVWKLRKVLSFNSLNVTSSFLALEIYIFLLSRFHLNVYFKCNDDVSLPLHDMGVFLILFSASPFSVWHWWKLLPVNLNIWMFNC